MHVDVIMHVDVVMHVDVIMHVEARKCFLNVFHIARELWRHFFSLSVAVLRPYVHDRPSTISSEETFLQGFLEILNRTLQNFHEIPRKRFIGGTTCIVIYATDCKSLHASITCRGHYEETFPVISQWLWSIRFRITIIYWRNVSSGLNSWCF